jgi:hypothetical protein
MTMQGGEENKTARAALAALLNNHQFLSMITKALRGKGRVTAQRGKAPRGKILTSDGRPCIAHLESWSQSNFVL